MKRDEAILALGKASVIARTLRNEEVNNRKIFTQAADLEMLLSIVAELLLDEKYDKLFK